MCTINGIEISDTTMQCVLTLINGSPTDGLQVEILYIVSSVLSIMLIFALLYIMRLIATYGKG